MSLEELMKKPSASSTWRQQRVKLIRVLAGVAISVIIIVCVMLVFFLKKQSQPVPVLSGAPQSQDVDSLSQLLKIQNEAKVLKNKIDKQRTESANLILPKPRVQVGGAHPIIGTTVVNYDPGEGFSKIVQIKSDVYIPTGAVFQAQLLTPIKTSVEKTFVMAETTNEYRLDMKRRILRGSRLIGRSHFDPVLKGVIVEFNLIVSPSGIEFPLTGLALSRNALPEIDGLYFSDKLVNYGTALAFGFLSGFADAGREREVTVLGSQPTVSTGNQVLAGLSTASFQVANQILNDIREHSIEYVVVPAGEAVFVVLTQRFDIIQEGSKGGAH